MSHTIHVRAPDAPAPLRFTRAEYHRMAEAGLFQRRRVELLEGEIIEMTPQRSRHASAVTLVVETLVRALSPSFLVRPQLPVILDDRSEPEPDVAVCLRDPHHYSAAHPGPEHVVLLVEVADTSLAYDRGRKAGAYARAGIPALWIIDLGGRCIEALSEPDRDRGRYFRQERLTEGASLLLPNGEAIRTSDLLPPA